MIPFADILFENPEVDIGKISNPVGPYFEKGVAIFGNGSLLKLLRDTDLLTIPGGIKKIAPTALGSFRFTSLTAPFLPSERDLGANAREIQEGLTEFELTDADYDISLEDL